MKVLRSFVVALALLTVALAGPAAATCGIQGTISATETRAGQWTYCVDFSYFSYSPIDVLTHVALFLPQNEANCSPSLVSFQPSPGTLRGLSAAGQCSVLLAGQFYCVGDPTINAPRVPTVAWTPSNSNLCPAAMPGTGHICFTLNAPPSAPREQVNAISTMSGMGQCWGTLSGQFPTSAAPVPSQSTSWSGIKAARYTD